MSQLQNLYRLQQYDTEILQKKRRLSEVVQLQRETEKLLSARQRQQETAAAVNKLTAQQTNLNLELGAVNDKAKRSENRLYSGQVSNPKELEDLQHEVEALGRRRAVLEDELLDAMIELEEAQANLDDAVETLAAIESDWQSSQAALKAEQDQLALELHELLGVRSSFEKRVDPAALAEYEAIRTRKHGLAVVGLANNSCMGCHVGVSSNVVLRVERGERVTCIGCGRILYPL